MVLEGRLLGQGQQDLPEEVVAAKHVRVPHRHPQGAALQLTQAAAPLEHEPIYGILYEELIKGFHGLSVQKYLNI